MVAEITLLWQLATYSYSVSLLLPPKWNMRQVVSENSVVTVSGSYIVSTAGPLCKFYNKLYTRAVQI